MLEEDEISPEFRRAAFLVIIRPIIFALMGLLCTVSFLLPKQRHGVEAFRHISEIVASDRGYFALIPAAFAFAVNLITAKACFFTLGPDGEIRRHGQGVAMMVFFTIGGMTMLIMQFIQTFR